MKSANGVLGKRIVGLNLKWAKSYQCGPDSSVFLIFDDETHYEFYAHENYLEMGRHLPVEHCKSVDLRYVNHYMVAEERLSQEPRDHTDADQLAKD
jgi:hypothetical protein